MSLWFAGAFDDSCYQPQSGKRMTNRHPSDLSAGNFISFGDGCGSQRPRRAHSAGATVGRPTHQHQHHSSDTFGIHHFDANANTMATPQKFGKRMAARDLVASRQNVEFGGFIEYPSPAKKNVGCGEAGPILSDSPAAAPNTGSHSASASTSAAVVNGVGSPNVSTRFRTPHRVAAMERGYAVNPITLQPMTAGPSSVPAEVQRRFEADAAQRGFFAGSTDAKEEVRGLRAPATIVNLMAQQQQQTQQQQQQQQQQTEVGNNNGAGHNGIAGDVTPSAAAPSTDHPLYPQRQQQQEHQPFNSNYNGNRRRAASAGASSFHRLGYRNGGGSADDGSLFSPFATSSSAYGRCHSLSAPKSGAETPQRRPTAHTTTQQTPTASSVPPAAVSVAAADTTPSVEGAYHSNSNNNYNNYSRSAVGGRGADSINGVVGPSYFVPPADSFPALSLGRTVLYSDHNKEEEVFLSGCRKRQVATPYGGAHRGQIGFLSEENEAASASSVVPYHSSGNGGGGVGGRYAHGRPQPICPYDTDFTASSSYFYNKKDDGSPATDLYLRTQKKMVSAPEGRTNATDEDAFMIKTSRMPPPEMMERSEKEGFAVLHSTDPGRLRSPLDGMRMLERRGKVASNFVKRTNEARLGREQQLMLERREKCMRAFEAERLRMATRRTHDESFIAARGRDHTPASASSTATPFALNMPAPHMSTVGKQTPWWKR